MTAVLHQWNEGEKEETPNAIEGAQLKMAFDNWLHSLQWKTLGTPDGHACLTGKCGETIEIFLKFDGERVKEAAYLTNGCISSKVCAALAAHMARGKTPDEVAEITAKSILEQLGEFPRSEEHCAFLAAETLQEALHRYMLRERRSRERR